MLNHDLNQDVTTEAPICVIGPGAWGTALALTIARNGHQVRLFGNEPEMMDILVSQRKHPLFSDEVFPETLQPMLSLADALDGVSDVLIVVPTFAFGSVLSDIYSIRKDGWRIAWATKGLYQDKPGDKPLMLKQMVSRQFSDSCAMCVISGPSFAAEVASQQPTCVNVAGNNSDFNKSMADRLANNHFRVQLSDDMTAVCLGGVIKNVIAIMAGMSDGLGWGANARCAIISWGYQEMASLVIALGGKESSLFAVSCIGDLILTSSDNQSRNRRLGVALGQGKSVEQALEEIASSVEGLANVEPISEMAKQNNISAPLLNTAQQILCQGADCRKSLEGLFSIREH